MKSHVDDSMNDACDAPMDMNNEADKEYVDDMGKVNLGDDCKVKQRSAKKSVNKKRKVTDDDLCITKQLPPKK